MSNENVKFIDIAISSQFTQSGEVEELYNSDALTNAWRIFIGSKRGDTLRRKTGGYLYPHLGKLMNPERADSIRQSLQDGIKQEFLPKLTIHLLDVTPDYNNRKWIIKLVASSEEFSGGINTIDEIRNGV